MTRKLGNAPRDDLVTRTDVERPSLWYVNVYVRDFERAVSFYRKTLGLRLRFRDDDHGYASFDTGPTGLALARIDPEQPEQLALVARQTGVALGVDDLLEAYEVLSKRGVEFPQRPTLQPWGGLLAVLRDCEGNLLYLDQRSQASSPPSATNSDPVQ